MKSFVLILMLITFISCEKKVDISFPAGKNEFVLNALIHPDSIVVARMTLLNYGLSATFPEPDSCELRLYENGIFKEMLTGVYRNGLKYYNSTMKASRGNAYKIVASVAGTALEGSDTIPAVTSLSDLQLEHLPGTGTGETKIYFRLNDNPDEHNYYLLRVYAAGQTSGAPGSVPFRVAGDINMGNNLYSDDYYKNYFIDDALFNGRNIPYALSIAQNADSVMLEVTALTATSYKYLKTADAASGRSDNILDEPVPVFCNIKNGLGIVGGIAVKRTMLK